MCGIAGQLSLDGDSVSPITIKQMTDAIAHRGPDGEGHWIENDIGLGHRRLAIIDLSSAGHQPMISSDHRFVLTYNGEVYNYKELRVELEAIGYWFRSNTDSEVVLNALAQWGPAALSRFNGMFALALWDRKDRRLLLARDRYGIKPLYFSQTPNVFSFASEQKSLLTQRSFFPTINTSALFEYFTFQNIFTNSTLVNGISLLEAGSYLTVDTKSTRANITRTQYWDYHFAEPNQCDDDQTYLEELDRLFTQAVNRQLVTDVELGSYLSGGMDSGSITAIAGKVYPYLKTFTCGFDLSSASGLELAFDERVKAEAMSYHIKTEHYEMVLKAGDMERIFAKLVYHLEEPRVGQSYPNYYAAQLASRFVKVVLSGAGGDELFGGYPWRYYRAVVNDNFEHYVDQYYAYWQRMLNDDQLRRLFSPIHNEVAHVNTRDIFRNVFGGEQRSTLGSPEDYVNHSLYFEAKTFLHGLFVVEDKLSMAHGLETRVPFMDNDLVDFAMRCPVRLKLTKLNDVVRINENEPGNKRGRYFERTRDGKQILRTAMSKYIPEQITEAVKQGFSAPDASWFKGDSIEFVRKQLLVNDAPIFQYLDRNVIRELVNEHLDGKTNRRLLIWSLLNVNEIIRHS